MRQNEKRRLRNRAHHSRMKTFVKKVVQAIEAQDVEGARTALQAAVPEIDRAASRGALKKKTASRQISRLSRAIHKLSVSADQHAN